MQLVLIMQRRLNDFSISQASDLENNCDEFEEGTNNVFCSMKLR